MSRFVASRFLEGLFALLFLSVVVFGMSRATGDVRDLLLPAEATQEDYDRVGRQLGLDEPLPVQYAKFFVSAIQLDLGVSVYSGEPVTELLVQRLGSSAILGFAAAVLVLAIGIPFGVIAAVARGSIADRAVSLLALLGMSIPPFWAGILFIQVFAVGLGWFPAGTDQGLSAIVLPAVTLALTGLAGVARLLRSTMLEVLDSEYIKLARIKGLSEGTVVWKHALKNALGPVVGYSSTLFVLMLTLAMTVEVVYAWPGIGQLTFNAILNRDFPLIQGVALAAATASILIGLAADVLYAYLDPRIRYDSH